MGTLYLVRHGQASLGADDYDQLSELGQRQCHQLGLWFADRGVRFEAALVGNLRRQAQSLAAIEQGLGLAAPVTIVPGLNEYDSEALIDTIEPGPRERPNTAELAREHFRLLRRALLRWMAGEVEPRGMPSHARFIADIEAALDEVRTRYHGDVLLVSSGGPISTAVGSVLRTPPETTIELNLRIRNSSVTEFHFTPRRHALVSFNALPHLDHADRRSWATYA